MALSTIQRQPTKIDYASTTQIRLLINQLPKVEFFAVSANIPSITLGETLFPTPYKEIPVMGDTLTYDNFSMDFIVDEYLENYLELHNWLIGIGFPKSRKQFSTYRSTTSETPVATRGTSIDIRDAQPATTSRSMFSDIILTILSNKNNPIVEVRFEDAYPSTLASLDFNQQATDVEYMIANATFSYKLYEIITL